MIFAVCLLLLLPSFSVALVDAPSPLLRDLCGAAVMQTASCENLFGAAPEFMLCEETAQTCSFNVRLDQSTCHQLCRRLGSTCVGALDNNASNCEAVSNSTDTCLTQRQTEICICERRNDVVSERVPCATAFGAAPEFQLCRESEDQCEFNARTNGGNCSEMCGQFNARCIDARENNGSSCDALPNNRDDCSTDRDTEICICERPFQSTP